MKNHQVIAVDLGTTTVKAAVYSDRGEERGLTRIAAPPVDGSSGGFDAEAYLEAVVEALRRAVTAAGVEASEVAAIVPASQRATLVVVDEGGSALGPAISWQGTACAEAAEGLYDRVGVARFRQLTGLSPSSIYTVAKLSALVEEAPSGLASARFALLHDYLLTRLGASKLVTDPSQASATGLWALGRGEWSEEILGVLGISVDRLPSVEPASSVAGGLDRGIAAAVGLFEGTPLLVGGADQQCATLGAGATGDGVSLLSLGTSAAIQCPIRPLASPELAGEGVLALAHVLPGWWVLEGFLRSFGSAFDWARRCLGLETVEALEVLSRQASMVDAPIFVPFLVGVGTPELDDAPRGALVGASLGAGPAEVAWAVLEGAAFEVRRALGAMAAPPEELRVMGATVRGFGELWLQRLADWIGLPLLEAEHAEATLAGAATLAWAGLGRNLGHPGSALLWRALPSSETVASVESRYLRYLRAVELSLAFTPRPTTSEGA